LKNIRRVFTVLVFFACAGVSRAQDSTSTRSAAEISEPYEGERDLTDVTRKLFHSKGPRGADTISEHFAWIPAVGYSLQTGFAAVVSSNLAFYTGAHNHATQKVSSILASITYSQYNQLIVPLQSDIWTKDNSFNIITDWRYMSYPSTTFGLGGHSLLSNGYTINFNYLKIHQTILRQVRRNFYAGLGIYYDHFWDVEEVNPPAGMVTSFQRYGLTPTVTAVGPAFRLLYDSRLNQVNPLQGFYGSLVYHPSFTFMGSDNNWQSLLIELRKYFPLGRGGHNTLALWSYNWLTLGPGKPPYLLLPSTGWDDFYNTGRGYIQGRYRGRNFIYLESEYRFGISRNGLLGGVVFANAESVSRAITQPLNTVAPGGGIGLRIKLNKYSGANLCVDYGFGVEGSRGISVNLGEVF
jgi:outer membrane protein assembly factor BamA